MRSPVLPFNLPKPAAAKAALRGDTVGDSIARSILKLPELGRRNPDAALLIEREIDDYMPAPDEGETIRRRRPPNAVLRNGRHWTQEGRLRIEETRARITTSRTHIVETRRRNLTSLAYALAIGQDPDA